MPSRSLIWPGRNSKPGFLPPKKTFGTAPKNLFLKCFLLETFEWKKNVPRNIFSSEYLFLIAPNNDYNNFNFYAYKNIILKITSKYSSKKTLCPNMAHLPFSASKTIVSTVSPQGKCHTSRILNRLRKNKKPNFKNIFFV